MTKISRNVNKNLKLSFLGSVAWPSREANITQHYLYLKYPLKVNKTWGADLAEYNFYSHDYKGCDGQGQIVNAQQIRNSAKPSTLSAGAAHDRKISPLPWNSIRDVENTAIVKNNDQL